jgi:hypothetical protein
MKKVKPQFEKATRQDEDNYVFDLDRESARFYRTYPEYRRKVFIIDAQKGAVVYPDLPEKKKVLDVLKGNEGIARYATWSVKNQVSRSVNFRDYGCVFIDTRGSRKGNPKLLGAEASADLENFFTLQHELGHQICRHGNIASNIGECVADTYASLVYIDTFGAGNKHLGNLAAMRAVELAFREDDGVHFTSPVVSTLPTPDKKNMREQATFHALHYHNKDMPALAYLEKSFDPFKGALPALAAGDFAILDSLVTTVALSDNSDVRKWGGIAARALLDGKVVCDGRRIQPDPARRSKLGVILDGKGFRPPAPGR